MDGEPSVLFKHDTFVLPSGGSEVPEPLTVNSESESLTETKGMSETVSW